MDGVEGSTVVEDLVDAGWEDAVGDTVVFGVVVGVLEADTVVPVASVAVDADVDAVLALLELGVVDEVSPTVVSGIEALPEKKNIHIQSIRINELCSIINCIHCN